MADPRDDELDDTDPMIRRAPLPVVPSLRAPHPAAPGTLGAASLGFNGQVEGTSDDGVTLPSAGDGPTGFAFAISTGGWLVRVTSTPCAGGFVTAENWPSAPDQWPASFTLTLTRYSYVRAGKAKWYTYGGVEADGPTAQDCPYGATWRGISKKEKPDFPHVEVKKNGVLVAYVDTLGGTVHWTHPNPPSDRVKLGHNDTASFTRKTQ